MYVCMYVCMYIYIHNKTLFFIYVFMYALIYIYIYIYIYTHTRNKQKRRLPLHGAWYPSFGARPMMPLASWVKKSLFLAGLKGLGFRV